VSPPEALAPDGRPVVGSITPASFVLFLSRLQQSFSNWPAILANLLLDAAHAGRSEMTSRARSGPVLTSPASRPAWWPVFEMLAEDLYRLSQLDITLGEGDVILDLGAHIGAAAVALARRFPAAELVCVEPNPSAFSYLEANLGANGLTAVTMQKAIGNKAGTTTLYGAETASCEASTSLARPGQSLEVEVVSFEQVVAEAPGAVRIVKLDCEGAEHEVVDDTLPGPWADVELVLVEYHETREAGRDWESLQERLSRLGFETFWQMAFYWRPGLGMAGLRRAQSRR
jgi:FkbM family methyltransferase